MKGLLGSGSHQFIYLLKYLFPDLYIFYVNSISFPKVKFLCFGIFMQWVFFHVSACVCMCVCVCEISACLFVCLFVCLFNCTFYACFLLFKT